MKQKLRICVFLWSLLRSVSINHAIDSEVNVQNYAKCFCILRTFLFRILILVGALKSGFISFFEGCSLNLILLSNSYNKKITNLMNYVPFGSCICSYVEIILF